MDAQTVVRNYLNVMERRDLAAARALLAPDFVMTFPGGKCYDTAPQADGTAVVYCFGALYGELLDGKPYEGIRFIDRFTVRDGRLVDQMVWNDMAEALGKTGG